MDIIKPPLQTDRTHKSGNTFFYLVTLFLIFVYIIYPTETTTIEQIINAGIAYDSRVTAYTFSFLIMLFGAFTPFPAELIALTNTFIYPPIEAFFVTWVSAVLSAQVAYEFGRVNNLDPCRYKDSNKICFWLSNYGYKSLAVLRLIPLVPFFALNICCGILKLNRRKYSVITAFTIIPAVALLSFFPRLFM